MARQFDVVVEKDSEGFFVASVPALAGCHTQARSLYELMVRVKERLNSASKPKKAIQKDWTLLVFRGSRFRRVEVLYRYG